MTSQTQPGATGAAAAPPTKGTVSTPQGPITWEKTSDGTVTALGNGQKFTSHGTQQSDGSWAQQANYAKTGQTSYLSLGSTGDVAGHKVQFLISAGTSRLTLTVANIDAGVTSGAATLSGIWNGAVVQWTGHADLTTNPLVSRPIAGWPQGAFATELQTAAFFAPLGSVLAQTLIAPAAAPNSPTLQPHSVVGVLGRAGAWCVGGAFAASGAAPLTAGTSVLLACAGGAAGSLLNDLVTWVDDEPPPVEPGEPPVISLPSDPEPTGPVTVTQPDDPPPGGDGGGSEGGDEGDGGDEGGDGDGGGDGGGGGGGGGGTGIDDKPPHEED